MEAKVTPNELIRTFSDRFDGTVIIKAWGEISLFYNPGQKLPRGVYFVTVKEKDGANDRASQLDREGVFRFNFGTTKPLFIERFGPTPARPSKGQVIDGNWDFTALDTLTPHPVYGWMSWVSVLNPSQQTMRKADEMIEAAYQKARIAFEKKAK